MNQLAKRGIALAAALAVTGGACFGGWKLYRSRGSSVVSVYDSVDLINTYYQEDARTDGVVTTDQFQSEYLSDTQSVKDVKVKAGQKVKKGDVLFTYDSTLTEIDLKRKQIEVQQKQLELNNASKELSKIKSYRPGKPIPGSSQSYEYGAEEESTVGKAVYKGLVLISGDGTQELPYSYLWKDSFLLEDALIAAAMQDKVDCFVRFYLGGKEISFPDPTPEPEPKPTPADESEEEPDQSSDEEKESGDDKKDDDGSASSGGDASGSQAEGSQDSTPPTDASGSQSGSGSDSSEGTEPDNGASSTGKLSGPVGGSEQGHGLTGQSGDAVQLSAREHAPTVRELFLLSATAGEAQGESSQQEQPEEPYSTAWVFHCQHTISGYRYIPVSIQVGGVERKVMNPMPQMSDAENPEMQPKPKPYQPEKPQKYTDPGITYTREELAQMRREQETIVRDCKLELRQLQVEQEKLERELNNSAVFSALDGVVLELNDPKKLEGNQPVLKVSGGGGYIIRGSVSELSLDCVQPGQTVHISDWSSGESYEGTVQSVSDYPTANGGWSDGNSNVSYYGFSVSVDASANLEQNSYVEMSYSQQDSSRTNSTYLLNSFIRSEGPKSYILYEQDGRLVKQYVQTGRSVWGMYTEIIGGLEPELYLAFPYGKNVREGAPTQHAGIDALYGA